MGRWKVGLIDFFILLLYHSPTFAVFLSSHRREAVVLLSHSFFSLFLYSSVFLSVYPSSIQRQKNKTECLNPSGSVVACHLVPRMLASPDLPSVPLFVTEVLVWGIASGT